MHNAEIFSHSEGYTICLEGKSPGPIISDINLNECKRKFREAILLGIAVRNLLYYEKHKTFYSVLPTEEIVYGNIKYVRDFD